MIAATVKSAKVLAMNILLVVWRGRTLSVVQEIAPGR